MLLFFFFWLCTGLFTITFKLEFRIPQLEVGHCRNAKPWILLMLVRGERWFKEENWIRTCFGLLLMQWLRPFFRWGPRFSVIWRLNTPKTAATQTCFFFLALGTFFFLLGLYLSIIPSSCTYTGGAYPFSSIAYTCMISSRCDSEQPMTSTLGLVLIPSLVSLIFPDRKSVV